jgi:hypothetical protein
MLDKLGALLSNETSFTAALKVIEKCGKIVRKNDK